MCRSQEYIYLRTNILPCRTWIITSIITEDDADLQGDSKGLEVTISPGFMAINTMVIRRGKKGVIENQGTL